MEKSFLRLSINRLTPNTDMTQTISTMDDMAANGTPVSHSARRHSFSRREQTLLIIFLLLGSTLLLYRPMLHAYFQTYDDPYYVVENAHVNTGLSWANIRWAFTSFDESNWHPLTWISHMMDVQIFGLKPMGHHLDSMLWHALNVVLLFLLLRAATGFVWRSATVAALFALCPLNVECVAWVAERKSLICTTFLLLTLFAYGWWVRHQKMTRYLAVCVLFAFALMAKPLAVTLPALLILVDCWPLERIDLSGPFDRALLKRFGQLFVEKIPLFILSAAGSVLTILAQKGGGALGWSEMIPLRLRVENAIYSYALYVVKMFWPSRLSIFYPHPRGSLNVWLVVAAGVALVVVTAAAWRYRRLGPLAAGWAWYLIALLPMIGLIQAGPQAWADRYAYVPYIGLFVVVVWLLADVAKHVNWSKWAAAIAAVLALSGYAWASHIQIGYWNNSKALFSHALELNPRNGMAYSFLGLASAGAGRYELAEQQFRAAAELMPTVAIFHFDLGLALERQGKFDEALRAYRQSWLLGAGADAFPHIANILLRNKDVSSAIAEYDAATHVGPKTPESLAWRGIIEYRMGNPGAAVADLSKSAALLPRADTYYALGRALETTGDIPGAKKAYERVLQLDRNYPNAAARLKALAGK